MKDFGTEKVLIDEKTLQKGIADMGALLTEEYRGRKLLVVGILKGSFVFLADLVRQIKLPCEIDFMAVSSYGSGTVSSGEVKIIKDIAQDLSEYDVLIAEDILDTGNTLSKLMVMLRERNPRSLKICVMLDKPTRRRANINADYTIFTIPDEFVIGFGLDCAEKYRNLPYIGIYTENDDK